MSSEFTCIYCMVAKPSDQRSKEHLLQRSLGGDLTAQFVCKVCNNELSKIDQALSDRSTVAISRVSLTPATAQKTKLGGLSTYYDSERELFIEIEIRNQMEAVVLPQMHLRSSGKGEAIVKDKAAMAQLVQFVDEHLGAGTIESIHRFHGLPNGMATKSAALVVRKPGEGYVRLPSAEDENWFFPMLKSGWEQDLKKGLVDTNARQQSGIFPEVRHDFKYAPNDVYRAIAKAAFNVLAFKRGSDFVLRSEFDPIRKYILGDLVLPSISGPEEIAVDQRFVAEIPPDQQQVSFIDDGHAVIFCYIKPTLFAFATLYGAHLFLVRFPELHYDESEDLFGHRFSIDRTGNSPLEMMDLIERLLKKHPATFGLTLEQAKQAIEILRSGDADLTDP